MYLTDLRENTLQDVITKLGVTKFSGFWGIDDLLGVPQRKGDISVDESLKFVGYSS